MSLCSIIQFELDCNVMVNGIYHETILMRNTFRQSLSLVRLYW